MNSEKLLQNLLLGFVPSLAMSFEVEKMLHRKKLPDIKGSAPVFVASMARSGTSPLLRTLYEDDSFASPTYGDLPLPLAPNLWKKLSRRVNRSVEPGPRGHGDGLVHDLETPEALEEIFWRTFSGTDYIGPDSLVPHIADDDVVADFRIFVAAIMLAAGKSRYLSKNNNNVLRVSSLRRAFPDALLVQPFRDPLDQAMSLWQQHSQAIALHAHDPFRPKFMKWLGHHEFGADHRPMLPDHIGRSTLDPSFPDYWLEQWVNIYGYLVDHYQRDPSNVFMVDMAECASNQIAAQKMVARILHRPIARNIDFRPSRAKPDIAFAGPLVERARQVHQKLKDAWDAGMS